MKLHRAVAGPALCLALAAPMLANCGGDPFSCDPEIAARVEAFSGAVDALVKVAGDLKVAVGTSCQKMAVDLGSTDAPTISASSSDEDVTTACNAAVTSLKAAIKVGVDAGGSISLVVAGGGCEVNASAQLNCEASCSVDGSCDPGSIEARCDPGELSGQCDAECTGSCTVETGSVECAGGCEGTCVGDCDATCEGNSSGDNSCNGKCTGNCTGQCSGTCKVVPPSASCSGSCKGGCSVAVKAPSCEAKLTPPSCDLDADCKAGCDAQGQLSASCTPPEIKVVIDGNFDANLATTLEANLPAIFLAFETQGKLFIDAAADVAEKAPGAATAALDSLGCAANYAVGLAAEFGASVEASVSVSVSIEASASVGAEANGG